MSASFNPVSVGSAEDTGTNTVTVTLTDDVPRGDPTAAKQLWVFIAQKETTPATGTPSAVAAKIFPTITDPAVPALPYSAASFASQLIAHGGQSTAMGIPYNATDLLRTHAYSYEVLNSLHAGDELTFTLDAAGAPVCGWLAVSLFVATGFYGAVVNASPFVAGLVSGGFGLGEGDVLFSEVNAAGVQNANWMLVPVLTDAYATSFSMTHNTHSGYAAIPTGVHVAEFVSWDRADEGHIGYMIYDLGAPPVGGMTVRVDRDSYTLVAGPAYDPVTNGGVQALQEGPGLPYPTDLPGVGLSLRFRAAGGEADTHTGPDEPPDGGVDMSHAYFRGV